MLRHSIPPFRRILEALRVERQIQRYASLTPEQRNEIMKYFISRMGIEPTICRVRSHIVPLRHDWPQYIHINKE